jgi:hypothetical protein
MAKSDAGGKLDLLAKLLDEIDVGSLTLDDVKGVKNPMLAQTLQSVVAAAPRPQLHHCSHIVHISHGSSMLQQ